MQVCILGDDEKAEGLAAAATVRFAVNKTVLRLPHEVIEQSSLPPALAETLPHLPEINQPHSFAVVCSGTSCQPPVFEAEKLIELLNSLVELQQ